MSYASGGLIEATDYNNLAWGGTQGTYTSSPTNIAYVMGVGNGEFGYGQDISAINTVAASNTVTATQWSGFLTTLNKALGHQSGSGAQISVDPAITAGNTITYFGSIATAVGTINTNKALFTAQGTTTTGTTQTWNPTAGPTVALSTFQDINVAFSSANAARYFFNAGGQINFVISAVDNAGSSRSQTLRDLINQAGGITAFRNTTNGGRSGSGGSAVTNNTSFGYRNLIFNNPQTIVNMDVAGTYSAHDVQLQLFANNSDTTNGSITSSIAFRLYIYAPADDAFAGDVGLTISLRADIVYPETTYLTSAWGTPVVSFDNT